VVTPTQRSTIDLVVIILTLMVAITIVFSAVGLVVGKIFNPALDIEPGAKFIGNALTTIIGALVGFMGGRATGRLEANGSK
jgi:hypothetical protein